MNISILSILNFSDIPKNAFSNVIKITEIPDLNFSDIPKNAFSNVIKITEIPAGFALKTRE